MQATAQTGTEGLATTADTATATAQATPAPATGAKDLAEELYALVVFLNKACTADLFEAMGTHDLSITQLKVLHVLEDVDRELTLKEAAERIRLSLPAASRTVDDLVRRGMVMRHEDSEDRRMKRVSITDVGSAVIRRVNAARLTGLEQFATTLNDDERTALAGALERLLQRADVALCRPEGI